MTKIDWTEIIDTSGLDDNVEIEALKYGGKLDIEQRLKPTAKGSIEYELEILEDTKVGQALFRYLKESGKKLVIEETSLGTHQQGNTIKINFSDLESKNISLIAVLGHEIAHVLDLDTKKNKKLTDEAISNLNSEIASKDIIEIDAKLEKISENLNEIRKNKFDIKQEILDSIQSSLNGIAKLQEYALRGAFYNNKNYGISLDFQEVLENVSESLNSSESIDSTVKILKGFKNKKMPSNIKNTKNDILDNLDELKKSGNQEFEALSEYAEILQNLDFKENPELKSLLKASIKKSEIIKNKSYLDRAGVEEYSIDIEMLLNYELGLKGYVRNHYEDNINDRNTLGIILTSENIGILQQDYAKQKPVKSERSEAWKNAFDEKKIDLNDIDSNFIKDLSDSGIIQSKEQNLAMVNENKLLKYSFDLVDTSLEDNLLAPEEIQKLGELKEILEKFDISMDNNFTEESINNYISIKGYLDVRGFSLETRR